MRHVYVACSEFSMFEMKNDNKNKQCMCPDNLVRIRFRIVVTIRVRVKVSIRVKNRIMNYDNLMLGLGD